MGGDHERRPVGVGEVEQFEQRLATDLVEADERLVDEHHVERAHERHGDRRLLLEAAAERHRQVVDAGGETDHLDHVDRLLLPVLGAVEPGDVLEVLPDAEVVVEHRLVGQVRHGGPRLDRADRMAGDRRRPLRRFEHPGEHAQQRGLAAAVVADQRDALAVLDAQVERCERLGVAVALARARA